MLSHTQRSLFESGNYLLESKGNGYVAFFQSYDQFLEGKIASNENFMVNVSNSFTTTAEIIWNMRISPYKMGQSTELSLTNEHLWNGGLSIGDAVSGDNLFDIGAAIINKCTVTINFPHDDFVVRERPSDKATTFREVISWVAQIAGCFCRCDVRII